MQLGNAPPSPLPAPSPSRLIEFYRRENRLLERKKHKTLLLCYNKPVSGRQTTQRRAHTQLSTLRAIEVCVRVCFGVKASMPWHVEIPKALAKFPTLPQPSLQVKHCSKGVAHTASHLSLWFHSGSSTSCYISPSTFPQVRWCGSTSSFLVTAAPVPLCLIRISPLKNTKKTRQNAQLNLLPRSPINYCDSF